MIVILPRYNQSYCIKRFSGDTVVNNAYSLNCKMTASSSLQEIVNNMMIITENKPKGFKNEKDVIEPRFLCLIQIQTTGIIRVITR